MTNITDRHDTSMLTKNRIHTHAVVKNLVERIHSSAWKKIETTSVGGRVFRLDSLPTVPLKVYHENISLTAEWLYETIQNNDPKKPIILYIGFEAFYDLSFDSLGTWLVLSQNQQKEQQPSQQDRTMNPVTDNLSHVSLVFSPLVKSTREYIQHKQIYEAMEQKEP
jgi:uncharacterized protein (DUF2225 family)